MAEGQKARVLEVPGARGDIAIVMQSAMSADPLPSDLARRRADRTAAHDKAAVDMAEAGDGEIAAIVETGESAMLDVAAPYRVRQAALRQDREAGRITEAGYTHFNAELRKEMAAALNSHPLNQRIDAAEQRFQDFAAVPSPTEAERAGAITAATELRLLSPAHGLAKMGVILREAIRTDDFGPVRAVLPFVKSLIESEGSAWYGNAKVHELVVTMESEARDWRQDFGEYRLDQVARVREHLAVLKKAVIESASLEDSFFYRLLDEEGQPINTFKARQLRLAPSPGLAARIERRRKTVR